MTMKSFALAAIALGCSVGVAAAQTPPPGPSPEQVQQVLNALAKQHAATGVAAGAPSGGSKADINNLGANIPLGFNFAHATNCGWFTPNGSDQWYYVFPLEGGIVFVINNINVAIGLETPCVNGNLFAWNVINSSTGAYNQTYSYPYRP